GRNRLDAMELSGRRDIDDSITRGRIPACCTVIEARDPFAYVVTKNFHRRHLTAAQKRELIAKELKAKPASSNLQIAKRAKADDKTVAKVRSELESTSEIPKLDKTTGREGKARAAKRTPKVDPAVLHVEPERPDEGKQKIGKPDFQALAASWRE